MGPSSSPEILGICARKGPHCQEIPDIAGSLSPRGPQALMHCCHEGVCSFLGPLTIACLVSLEHPTFSPWLTRQAEQTASAKGLAAKQTAAAPGAPEASI